jgi:hypothetical protein
VHLHSTILVSGKAPLTPFFHHWRVVCARVLFSPTSHVVSVTCTSRAFDLLFNQGFIPTSSITLAFAISLPPGRPDQSAGDDCQFGSFRDVGTSGNST